MTKHTLQQITIHKLDVSGGELWRYHGRLLHRDESKLVLEANFDRDEVEIAGLNLRKGDRFVETFYFDRWYNIFEIYDGNTGRHKGWYCNITRPARLDAQDLYAEDLALDIIVLPDRQLVIVDQDEFEGLDLTPGDRAESLQALEALIELARSGKEPFN